MSLLSLLLSALALAGAPEAPVVGVVCSRQGACAIVYGPGMAPGQELVVARPRLLIALAGNQGKRSVWGEWEKVGRLRVRRLLAKNYALAFVTEETQRTAGPAQNVRPGDPVLKPQGAKSAEPSR